MTSRGGGTPWRALTALTAIIAAVHMMLLSASPGVVRIEDPLRNTPLVMRRIEASPPLAPPPVATAVPQPQHVEPAPRKPAENAAPDTAAAPAAVSPMRAPSAVPPHIATPAPREPSAAAAAPPVAPAPSFTIPGSMRLHYKVLAHSRGSDVQAQAELLWRHDGRRYEARMEVALPLLTPRVQRSTGFITPEGLAPTRFSDKSRSEEATHFERGPSRIVFSSNRPPADLLPGAQDRLSVLLQLGALIAGEPARFIAGTHIPIQTAGTRDAEVWQFTVQGEEDLQLPGGNLRAIKLFRLARHDYDQAVELWLAPGMDYAPVRLRLTQANADWLDQQWSGTDR
jgi:hypothetical protein